ncbi:MAG: hypothetical protein ACE15C_08005 [Phycisphaerae bacterium]
MSGEDQIPEQEYDKVLKGLSRIAVQIERRKYPGHAWPALRVHERTGPRLIWFAIPAAAAMAAALLLAVVLRFAGQGTSPIGPQGGVATSSSADVSHSLALMVPDMSESLEAGELKMELPSISLPAAPSLSLPSAEITDGMTLSLPSLSLPSYGEKSGNNDS